MKAGHVNDINISLKMSSLGTPYIDMGDLGRLIFSSTLKCPLGYKWMCYVRRYVNEVKLKNTVGGRQTAKISELDSIMYTFKLFRDTEDWRGVKKGTIPPKIQKWLRKMFKELCVEKDNILFFPDRALDTLKSRIEKTNFDKIVKKPEKRKRKEKNETPS